MKFRFYITDLIDGSVKGTDSEAVVAELRESEEYFVVDTDTGKWLLSEGVAANIKDINQPGENE